MFGAASILTFVPMVAYSSMASKKHNSSHNLSGFGSIALNLPTSARSTMMTKGTDLISSKSPPRSSMVTVTDLEGAISLDGLVFRQNFLIRSYDIGPDGTASIETLMNLLQETVINRFKTAGLPSSGFGRTPEMLRSNLIWVQNWRKIIIDRYPAWGDVIQVECWLSASGKTAMLTHWLVRDYRTTEILARSSSLFAMMNMLTRRLSKIPENVHAELERIFVNWNCVMTEDRERLLKLDTEKMDCYHTNIKPGWSDLDVNQHVNNISYIRWMLESVPLEVLETHELATVTMEYRKECVRNSILNSGIAISGESRPDGEMECLHLLQLDDGAEVLRGKTTWRPKDATSVLLKNTT